jgi:DUF4097 and DUF4098 domain-containing protein YvlB
MKRATWILICVFLAAAAVASAERPVNQTVKADLGGEVSVSVISGTIEVSGWDRADVEVTGTVGDDIEELVVARSGDRVIVEAKYPDHGRRNMDLDCNLTIRIPVALEIEVETVSADITARYLTGEVELQSVSGEITVMDGPGELEVTSVSGNISIDFAPDGTEAATVSGEIRINQAAGSLEAASVSGDIVVRGGTLDEAEFESVSGDIVIGAELRGGELEIETMSGDVEVDASISDARIRVSTFSGRIKNHLTGDLPRRTSEHTPGSELEIVLGSGDTDISIESFSGSVVLGRR